jgi:hypothetical protein
MGSGWITSLVSPAHGVTVALSLRRMDTGSANADRDVLCSLYHSTPCRTSARQTSNGLATIFVPWSSPCARPAHIHHLRRSTPSHPSAHGSLPPVLNCHSAHGALSLIVSPRHRLLPARLTPSPPLSLAPSLLRSLTPSLRSLARSLGQAKPPSARSSARRTRS